jgi:hypothetical protein
LTYSYGKPDQFAGQRHSELSQGFVVRAPLDKLLEPFQKCPDHAVVIQVASPRGAQWFILCSSREQDGQSAVDTMAIAVNSTSQKLVDAAQLAVNSRDHDAISSCMKSLRAGCRLLPVALFSTDEGNTLIKSRH